MSANGTSQFFTLGNGVRVHARAWPATPSKRDPETVCVLLHGFGDGNYIWDPFAAQADSPFDLLALDLRGHGESAWSIDGHYSMDLYTSDVIEVVAALPYSRVVCIGHSMGAEIAIRAIPLVGDRIYGLMIVDFGPGLNPEGLARIRDDIRDSFAARHESLEALTAWMMERRPLASSDLVGSLARSAYVEEGSGVLKMKGDPLIAEADEDRTDDAELWRLLAAFERPAAIVRGSGSALLSRHTAERIVTEMPNAAFHAVPIAGHAVMIDNPEAFLGLASAFLERLAIRDGEPSRANRAATCG